MVDEAMEAVRSRLRLDGIGPADASGSSAASESAALAKRCAVRSGSVQANGETFHVIEQGRGSAILFCHGFPDTAETWRKQMRAVAGAGYRAVALDMRGYGRSYSPADPDLYTSLHIVGDLVGVLDALEIPSAVLVGHDWGADHAQQAMFMRPDRFQALVSLSIPFRPRGELSFREQRRRRGLENLYYGFDNLKPDAEERFADATKSIPSLLYWLSASPPPDLRWNPVNPALHWLRPSPEEVPGWADPEYVRHNVSSFQRTGFRGGLNYYRAQQLGFDLTSAFKHAIIQQPSLYIWGAADGLCQFYHPTTPTLSDLRRFQPGLVDQIRLDDVGHWIQHEAADRLNAELIKFLRTVTPE